MRLQTHFEAASQHFIHYTPRSPSTQRKIKSTVYWNAIDNVMNLHLLRGAFSVMVIFIENGINDLIGFGFFV